MCDAIPIDIMLILLCNPTTHSFSLVLSFPSYDKGVIDDFKEQQASMLFWMH